MSDEFYDFGVEILELTYTLYALFKRHWTMFANQP